MVLAPGDGFDGNIATSSAFALHVFPFNLVILDFDRDQTEFPLQLAT